VGGFFILTLLRERDGRLFTADTHLQPRTAGADRQIAIPQPADQVERLTGRLLARQTQRVRRHRGFDRCAYGGRRTKEAIRRGQSLQPLMGTLEVVVLHEQPHPPLAVLEVRKHGARQKLLPHRLPEPLDLPAGLGMMRAALHVRDPLPTQFRLKLGRAPPGGVLSALIGQDLPWRPVLGNAA
jgi:hypothetical protein